jgi:hypothetical protein
MLVAVLVALAASVVAQYSVYASFGGIAGMVDTYMSRRVGEDPFAGFGVVAVFAESFPIVFTIGLAVLTRNHPLWRYRLTFLVAMAVVFVSAIYFGGLKGSRSTIFFVLAWAVGVLHIWVRPIPKKMVVAGPLLLFLFMNVYLYYKRGGLEGFINIGDAVAREELTGGAIEGSPELFILLHDFARADINALVLYMIHSADDYDYPWGRSYLAAVVSVVPRALWPDRPETLSAERSNLLFGRGADVYVPYAIGLAGEAVMNFGPLAMPLTFIFVGFLVVGVSEMRSRLDPLDARGLLYPLFVVLCFVVPMSELESVFYTLVKNGFVPFLIVLVASDRVPRSTLAGGP